MIRLLVFFIVISLAVSCSADIDIQKPDVGKFVQMIKDGSYAMKPYRDELPVFSAYDIGLLMLHVRDSSEIGFFPGHPDLIEKVTPLRLGECLLWTIEGVRVGFKYPSMTPTLVYITDGGSLERISNSQLIEVAEVYEQWWFENRSDPSNLSGTDPLQGTALFWH